MRKKFGEIEEGDLLYEVNPSSEKCVIKAYTVVEVCEPVNDKEVMLYVDDRPHPWFVPKDRTSQYDLLFTTEEDARQGMIRQINHSIEYHESMIEKYKEQLKEFVD